MPEKLPSALKQDLKTNSFAPLYIFYGEENYLQTVYLNAFKKKLVGEGDFSEFNFFEFDGKFLSPDYFLDAIESYPVMAEKKLVIVHDFDLYKMPAAFQEILPNLLNDLPDYICLIFHYNVLSLKQDKRLKIHKILSKIGCFVCFDRLREKELTKWIAQYFAKHQQQIDQDTIQYFLFLCGNSMTNLLTEMEKLSSFCSIGVITRQDIDTVCIKILDAVVFDLSDAITERNFEKAIALVRELLTQKNSEISIFSTIAKHIQRLYAAKLNQLSYGSEQELLTLIESSSKYYARRIDSAARALPLDWLRQVVLLCNQTDVAIKSTTGDKVSLIEFTLLQMATRLEQV